MSPEEAPAAALHETDGTQHYITHQAVNGEDFELVACNGVGHEDDADIVRATLTAEGYAIVRSDELARLREAASTLCHFAGRFSAGDIDIDRSDVQVAIDDLRAALEDRP